MTRLDKGVTADGSGAYFVYEFVDDNEGSCILGSSLPVSRSRSKGESND